jgi:hypothetical protein
MLSGKLKRIELRTAIYNRCYLLKRIGLRAAIHRQLLAVVLCIPVLLSACALNGVDILLTPPHLNEQQTAIETALKAAVTGTIRLKYPKDGENLSAFTIGDIDGDGGDEAIVFYERTNLSAEDISLRLNILDSKNGEWNSVYDYATPGVEVERVMISPLGDSKNKLIVSYSTINQNEHILEVYDYTDNILSSSLSETCSYFNLFDTGEDETNEILMISTKNSNAPAKFRCLKYLEGVYLKTEIELSENALFPTQVLYENKNSRFYIDMNIGNNSFQTEIIEFENDNFYDLLYVKTLPELEDRDIQLLKQKTVRPSGYISSDINGDGVVEIPIMSEVQDSLPLVEWVIYTEKSLDTTLSGYYNTLNNYAFIFPSELYSKIRVYEDTLNNALIFKHSETGDIIYKLAIVTSNLIPDKSREGFKIVGTVDKANYMLYVNTDYDTFEQCAARFRLRIS